MQQRIYQRKVIHCRPTGYLNNTTLYLVEQHSTLSLSSRLIRSEDPRGQIEKLNERQRFQCWEERIPSSELQTVNYHCPEM